MKKKFTKIWGVGLAVLVIASMLLIAAPVSAALPAINEWDQFDYPAAGAAGDWFRDSDIRRVGEITEAVDGTLYVAVQRAIYNTEAPPWVNFEFEIDSGTLTITEFDYEALGTDTGKITGEFEGSWDGPEKDYVAHCDVSFGTSWHGTVCIWGTVTATSLTFEGSIEGLDVGWLPEGTWDIDEEGDESDFHVCPGGFGVYWGDLDLFGETSDVHFDGWTDISTMVMKSTDGGRTWEDTDYPGGWVVDMAPSGLDADILYVVDGHYVYKTDDAGDSWEYVGKDSLELQLAGACGVPACCCGDENCKLYPNCVDGGYEFSCPITSVDVGYDNADDPYVYIGTRGHCSGLDLDGDTWLDEFPGSIYYLGEDEYPAEWQDLNLGCYSCGGYDVLAVACAPDFADTQRTYAVVSTDDANCDDDNGDFETHVVYTAGTVCGWHEVAELKWDCVYSFGSSFASRIRFPDDWEDTGTLFVGVVDCNRCGGDGGDVYSVASGGALDLNVYGSSTGCIGDESVGIISLDVMGDTDDASLIAGAFCDNEVYCSYDGGWTWTDSTKDPTGENLTYVIWYEDSALAATAGYECAVSLSCGEDLCDYWNQISLIATGIDCVEDLSFAPGYVVESQTMFMLTKRGLCDDCEEEGYTHSVWRYDGTYWERVFLALEDDLDWVEVSPDFNTTGAVYLVGDDFDMWRTLNEGCSWSQLSYPCSPKPDISAVIVLDSETVVAGGCEGDAGTVFKTTRHGSRPWKEYTYDSTSAGCVISFDVDGDWLMLGDDISQVFISEDLGETWDQVDDAPISDYSGGCDTWVAFDPGFGVSGDPGENMIYAAACWVVERSVIDTDLAWSKQAWKNIYTGNVDDTRFWGIKAVGDTALYVADFDWVQYGDEEGGIIRSLNPTAASAGDVYFEAVNAGLPEHEFYYGLWLTEGVNGCPNSNVLWLLGEWRDCGNCAEIWFYEDTLATPVILTAPATGSMLTTTTSATLEWQKLCDATAYQIYLYYYCAACPEKTVLFDYCADCETSAACVGCSGETCCEPISGLSAGVEYTWKVRVCEGYPTLSKWSAEWTFTTALYPVASLCSPVCGAEDVIISPNFSWEEVSSATGYQVQIATNEDFDPVVAEGTTTVNAWMGAPELDNGTTYYWRVRAEKDGVYGSWTTCIFTTEQPAPEPPADVWVCPYDGLTFDSRDALEAHLAEAHAPVVPTTPLYIWVIIGIGALLVIAVIILVIRTRRVA